MVPNEDEPEARTANTVIEWNYNLEIQLFLTLAHAKPVGLKKRFEIAFMTERMWEKNEDIRTHDLRDHLSRYYNMAALDATWNNKLCKMDGPFSLPESDYGELMRQKCKDIVIGEETDDRGSPSPKISTPRRGSTKGSSKDSTPKAPTTPAVAVARKDSATAMSTKSRKESGSSHASTDTPSNRSDKEYDRRRDSRDSNASGPKDSIRKSMSQKDKGKPKVASAATWESPAPIADEDTGRRARRRANTSTPPATTPAKRRRT